MFRKIILSIIKVLEKISKKRILFINKKPFLLNNTAALSSLGFWYVGNVYDMEDLSYSIANKGILEQDGTNLVKKILEFLSKKQNIVLYDIGANSGYYGILSAYLFNKKINVYSFEPLSEYIDCIKKSVYLNKLENLKTFEFGLGDKDEDKTIFISGTGSSFDENFSGDHRNKRVLKIKKLDNVVEKEQITKPDFIKMDVEGYEQKVLEGGNNTITENTPVLFIEIVYSMKNMGSSYINDNYKKTFNLLIEKGYEVYSFENGKLEKFNTDNKPDGIKMYLFLHKDKHIDLKNQILKESF